MIVMFQMSLEANQSLTVLHAHQDMTVRIKGSLNQMDLTPAVYRCYVLVISVMKEVTMKLVVPSEIISPSGDKEAVIPVHKAHTVKTLVSLVCNV